MVVTREQLAIHHMLNVWRQYNSWGSTDAAFTHASMSAGEDAAEYLQALGYGVDDGYRFALNQKGIDLMHADIEDIIE